VLLKQRENDRKELEEKVYSNVKELTLRYIHMLKETKVYWPPSPSPARLKGLQHQLSHLGLGMAGY
jgi:hypothetical protein